MSPLVFTAWQDELSKIAAASRTGQIRSPKLRSGPTAASLHTVREFTRAGGGTFGPAKPPLATRAATMLKRRIAKFILTGGKVRA